MMARVASAGDGSVVTDTSLSTSLRVMPSTTTFPGFTDDTRSRSSSGVVTALPSTVRITSSTSSTPADGPSGATPDTTTVVVMATLAWRRAATVAWSCVVSGG